MNVKKILVDKSIFVKFLDYSFTKDIASRVITEINQQYVQNGWQVVINSKSINCEFGWKLKCCPRIINRCKFVFSLS